LAYVTPTSHSPVTDPRQVTPATIQVEQTHGPILVISGDDDGIWTSSYMSNEVIRRLKASHFPYRADRLNYPHVGHRAGSPEIVPAWTGGATQRQTGEPQDPGGSPEGNALSSLDATPRVLDFLEQAFASK
jgi:hypothetical protein